MMEEKNFLTFLCVMTIAAGVFIAKDECPPNEEYLLCGSPCASNCSNPQSPTSCSDDCVEGCFCKTGFLRNDNGTCVSTDQCPGSTNPICGDNEEFLSCGTACPLTCSQPDPGECGVACSRGCFCRAGFVRDVPNNRCVTLDNCPAEQCLNPNEVYDICNAECEPTCSDPEPICTKICSGGCVCAAGLLRDGNGSCISVDRCPLANSTDPGLLGQYLNVIYKILHLSSA